MDRDFTLFLMPGLRAKLEAQAKTKQRRTAKPGTIGAMTAAQFKETIKAGLSKAGPGKIKGRPFVQFKTLGITAPEHAEALKMLLCMTKADRQKLMDQLAAIEQAAVDWNMLAGDVIDLIKG